MFIFCRKNQGARAVADGAPQTNKKHYPTRKNERYVFCARIGGQATPSIVSSLSPSLAVIATRSAILRTSSAVTECAYSPPWVVGLASCLASPRGGVSHVKSCAFLPSLAAVVGKREPLRLCRPLCLGRGSILPRLAHFRAVFPGFSKGFAEPCFAPRHGIEPCYCPHYPQFLCTFSELKMKPYGAIVRILLRLFPLFRRGGFSMLRLAC